MLGRVYEKGSRFADKRGNTYKIETCAKDVQTGETIVVYSQEWGELQTLCCPMDAFRVSMTPVEEAGDLAPAGDTKKPSTGEERMLAFLDEDEFDKKSAILKEMYVRGELTDFIIDNLAAALDVVIEEGDLQSRYDQLRFCVDTRARFETSRLR